LAAGLDVQFAGVAIMGYRGILTLLLMHATVWHTAAAQPKKKNVPDALPPEIVLAARSMQPSAVVPDLIAIKPEIPLGPRDVLKSYEITMNLLADKTSSDFLAIVQAQRAIQITCEQAEYLLQQQYQTAMMQYQVLSALHDVLKLEIDKAELTSQRSLRDARSREVLVVPFPGSPSESK
jgi:hypothetical protein